MSSNKKCAFTICAKNYIGLAMILESSLRKFNDDIDFFIFVTDETDTDINIEGYNILIASQCFSSTIPWVDMSFKYDITEFATSIKPCCFKYLFETANYDKAIYLDPDIYIYNKFDSIYDQLDAYSLILTPHITEIDDNYKGDLSENNILSSGVFNLGFCAVKNSIEGLKFIEWWKNRLINSCFSNTSENLFTDQRWIDMIPCLLSSEELYIDRNIGLNVAPWNFFEREIIQKEDRFFTRKRGAKSTDLQEIFFVHYSGYDYLNLLKNNIIQKNIENFPNYPDVALLLNSYKNAIISKEKLFNKFINLKYTYNYFEDGTPISPFHRRLYNGIEDRSKSYPDPFSTRENSYFYFLKKKRLFFKDTSIQKFTRKTPSIQKKFEKVNKVLYYIYKIIGMDRFYLLIRFFKLYSKIEIYSFLLHENKKRTI